MHKLVLIAAVLGLAACGKDSDSKAHASAGGTPGGKTLKELTAAAEAPDDLRNAVPADVVVGRPLKVAVENAPSGEPHRIIVETCIAGEPDTVFVPLGEWVKRERPGAFSVTGTIDIQAHWKGGEIRGYSDRGNGCNPDEYHARFAIYRSND